MCYYAYEVNAMNELNDFYDIINALRLKCHISVRQLAKDMRIPPTTLASILTRRAQFLDREIVIRFGITFGIPWYNLLNKDSAAEVRTTGTTLPRVAVDMTEEDIQSVQKRIVEPFRGPSWCETQEAESTNEERAGDADFKRGMMFVIDRLNGDGLLLAMQQLIKIAADPKYCLSTNSHTLSNAKEDKECQENEP